MLFLVTLTRLQNYFYPHIQAKLNKNLYYLITKEIQRYIMENLSKLNERLSSLKQSRCALINFNDKEKEWLKSTTTLLGLPKEQLDLYCEILSLANLKVIWLHMEECSGCSESILMSPEFGFERFVIDFMQIQYHDMLMANSGHQTKQTLKESIGSSPYILIVEGSVSEEGDMYLTLGAEAHSGAYECRELAQNAEFVIAVGSCSSFGGIQVAYPNPTKAKPLSEIIHKPTINITGCPPSDTNICTTLLYLAIMGEIPPLDEFNRPLWSYGKSVHDLCERKGAFGAGEFVEEFGDEGSKLGYCLYKVGCRGPYVYNNCGKVKFNNKTSWPIQAGHGCIGCSEPNFWDNMGQFEKVMSNQIPKLTPDEKYFPAFANYQTIPNIKSLEEFKNLCEEEGLEEAKAIILDWEGESKIYHYTQQESRTCNAFNFESNIKILFDTLASKTKIGGKLAQNYYKAFPNKQSFLPSLSDENQISNNLCDIFGGLCALIGEDRIYNNKELLQLAQNFKHPYSSKYTLKFKADAEGNYNVDFSKFLNPFLSYAVGGLDIYGLCYGVVDSYAEAFGKIIGDCKNVFLLGNVFAENNLFVQKCLRYGRNKEFFVGF